MMACGWCILLHTGLKGCQCCTCVCGDIPAVYQACGTRALQDTITVRAVRSCDARKAAAAATPGRTQAVCPGELWVAQRLACRCCEQWLPAECSVADSSACPPHGSQRLHRVLQRLRGICRALRLRCGEALLAASHLDVWPTTGPQAWLMCGHSPCSSAACCIFCSEHSAQYVSFHLVN